MERLSDPMLLALWAIAAGSGGGSSRGNTVAALRRKGLIRGMESQGGWSWFTTPQGDAVLDGDERSNPTRDIPPGVGVE